MSKPATLYPRPEPMKVNTNFIVFGSGLTGALFFILGWTFQNVVIV